MSTWSRPEARSLKIRNLTSEQVKAAAFIAAALTEAIKHLPEADSSKTNLQRFIDDRRASQLVMVTGEPGNGKSTVYLTLWKCCEDKRSPYFTETGAEDRSDAEPQRPIQNGPDSSSKDRLEFEERIKNFADAHGKDLIWLKPLDLGPMTGRVNFLAALLARLEDAMNLDGRSREQGLLSSTDDYQKCMEQLRRLQVDVAISWDDAIIDRSGAKDLDVHAQDLRRTERARLDILRRFGDLLDNLAALASKPATGKNKTLFVLPIDDLYLDPAMSLDVLRMLRMVSVPRLFTLILGDMDVIDELTWHRLLGDHLRVLGESVNRLPDEELASVRIRTRQLASAAMRKLVPLGQRIQVLPLEATEALDMQVHNTAVNSYLERVKLDDTQQPKTLADLIDNRRSTRWSTANGDLKKWTPRDALEVPPRVIIDLCSRIENLFPQDTKVHKDERELRVLELIGEELLAALSETTNVKEDEREAIASAIYPKRDADDWRRYRIVSKKVKPEYPKKGRRAGQDPTVQKVQWCVGGDSLPPRIAAWLEILRLVLDGHGDGSVPAALPIRVNIRKDQKPPSRSARPTPARSARRPSRPSSK